MADVREILTEAHADIGVLGAGETLSAEQGVFGLMKLNRVIYSWRTQNLTIISTTRTTQALVSGTPSYLVGPTGAIVMARPIFVDDVRFTDSSITNSPEFPLTRLDDAGYQGLTFKTLTNALPSNYYWLNTYPNARLYLWMVPTSSTLTVVIYAKTAITGFTALADTFDEPPGYRAALVGAVAIAMAPGYGIDLPPMLVHRAMSD